MRRAPLLAVLAACASLAAGCSSKEPAREPATTPASPTTAAPAPRASASASAQPAALCIDPSDLQIEPIDLEALDDEIPAFEPRGVLATMLDGLAERGTLVPMDDGGVIVPFVRCEAAACKAGVMIADAGGASRVSRPLPGVGSVPPGGRLDFVVAQADINSSGVADLWLGYRTGGGAEPTIQHVAALSLPALDVQWHGAVSTSGAGDKAEGCEGTLHGVDADCDGDGDLVLTQRCGSMACLGDDSPGCEGALTTRVHIHLWDPARGVYTPHGAEIPASEP